MSMVDDVFAEFSQEVLNREESPSNFHEPDADWIRPSYFNEPDAAESEPDAVDLIDAQTACTNDAPTCSCCVEPMELSDAGGAKRKAEDIPDQGFQRIKRKRFRQKIRYIEHRENSMTVQKAQNYVALMMLTRNDKQRTIISLNEDYVETCQGELIKDPLKK